MVEYAKQFNCVAGSSQMLFTKKPVQTENKGFNFNSTQNFLLPKDFSIGLSGFYSSKFLWGLYVTQPYGSIDVGVQKKIGKKKICIIIQCKQYF